MTDRSAMSLAEFVQDYDWRCAFNEANGRWLPRPSMGYTGSLASFDIEDIDAILAMSDGERDGPAWIGAFRLKDGRFLMVRAGCDFTGWDCQASGDSEVADSLENLVRWSMNANERTRLGYGL